MTDPAELPVVEEFIKLWFIGCAHISGNIDSQFVLKPTVCEALCQVLYYSNLLNSHNNTILWVRKLRSNDSLQIPWCISDGAKFEVRQYSSRAHV